MALTTLQEALCYYGKFNKKVVKYRRPKNVREDQMIDRLGQLEKTGEAPREKVFDT